MIPERALIQPDHKTEIRKTDQFPTYPTPDVGKYRQAEKILGYDPLFDINAYKGLADLKPQVSEEEFDRRKTQLNLRTRHNLETALGERFKVEISQVTYQVIDGNLQSPEHDERFIEIIKRGQRYRQKNGSKETAREHAEVEGFARAEKILTDPRFDGVKIIIISPRGQNDSMYQHNFFDIWEKHGDCVTISRYTTSTTYKQFMKAAAAFDQFNNLPQNPCDADFLKTPLLTYKSLEPILALFPPDGNTITRQELEEITAICSQLIINYVNNPLLKTYNALLNFADALAGKAPGLEAIIRKTAHFQTYSTPDVGSLVNYFGSFPVRQVAAGCGLQTDFSSIVSGQLSVVNSPFSVAEFGKSCPECQTSADHFHCPREKGGCGGKIPSGAGITKCPHCSLTKEQAGSNCA
ncbi:hypothetical protein A3J17_01205 [Candidatus Curtissbacteria bacterium RIFCSPLOWO2_02_FULL_40_11]|uniref:Uncharacterized protein n=1 Tax=Candidatus Curtissbacteria bacterium RIFCSPHIGHO2_02_FULL_40_16b TaxID=1797714 RepID=A0A1F5GAT5_9BACT|nr:MAG: hypothetical protein A3D04_01385 [Candidatus Curtissbacteria bacterium RIFCSPHIGHO2_02_FULL_40_16b]OGD99411.1 MAG: hypothetical protein A3J17_01205 [Candidatus Curtissbacteria bacterium RIFCSPLOWO2_02_FULL_40_11]